jgi:biopolymer transport protein ExbD
LDANIPQPPPPETTGQEDPSRTIVVSIDGSENLKINQEDVTKDRLGDRLTDIFQISE